MSLLLALAALVIAILALSRAATEASKLRREIDELRAALARLSRTREGMGATEDVPAEQAPAPALPRSPARPAAPPLREATPAGPREPAAGPRRLLEAQLGSQLPVWLGAAALVLAASYLVKYSFDRDLLTPAARIAMGVGMGLAAIAGGEWLRSRSARVAEGLAAAGVGAIYASLLAAVSLYGLLSPALGFTLLALNTAAAVALALRHGFLVGVVGLVGGFVHPALIGAREPAVPALLAYLFLLEVALLAVARRQGWWPLAALAGAASLCWAAFVALELSLAHGSSTALALFLLGTSGALVFFCREEEAPAGSSAAPPRATLLPWLGAGVSLLLMAVVVGRSDFRPLEWGYFATLGAGAVLLGRLRPRYRPLAWLAAGGSVALLLHWAGQGPPALRFSLTLAAFAVLYAGGAALASAEAEEPAPWAALSAASALGLALAAGRGLPDAPTGSLGLALGAAGLAYAGAARRVLRAEQRATAAAFAVAAVGLFALGAAFELERAWIAVAWAVEALAAVWLAERFVLPPLRSLGALLAAGVLARLLLNPAVLHYPIGDHLWWNWLLYGYGLSALCLLAAAEVAHRAGRAPRLSLAMGLGGIALAAALVLLQLRHFFHGSHLDVARFRVDEWGAISVGLLVLGLALLEIHRRAPRRFLVTGGSAVVAASLVQALLAQGLLANPLWTGAAVGARPLWNGLLLVYAAPAFLAGLAVRRLPAAGALRRAAGVAALLLVFAWVSLEVRHSFHGSVLAGGATSNAELWTYSIAWILLGTALLVLGIATRSRTARYASLAVMLLAVAKVFLYDTAALRDLYRVLSLFGLGVSLLVLAFLYQRFVLPRNEE